MVTCVACTKEVRPRQHAIMCDVCNQWQHRVCQTGIDVATYRQMKKGLIDLDFTCKRCQLPPPSPQRAPPSPRRPASPAPAPSSPRRPASPAPAPSSPRRPASPAPAPSSIRRPASPTPATSSPRRPAPAPSSPRRPASPAPAPSSPRRPASPAPAPSSIRRPASPTPATSSPRRPAPAPSSPRRPASPAPACPLPPTPPLSPSPPPSPSADSSFDLTTASIAAPNDVFEDSITDPDPLPVTDVPESRGPEWNILPEGSKRGKPLLVEYVGYSYTVQKSLPHVTYWWCSVRPKTGRCAASVIQRGETFTRGAADHYHPFTTGLLTKAKIDMKLRKVAKSRNYHKSSGVMAEEIYRAERDPKRPCPALAPLSQAARRINYHRRRRQPTASSSV